MKPVDQEEFFKFLFGDLEGYLCIVTINRERGNITKQRFYEYPKDLQKALRFVELNQARLDTYFPPFLLTRERRRKEDIAETPVVWADGDECPVNALLLQPSAIVRTSEDKYHFYWKFREVQTPDIGESVSKRIAYYHVDDGMDKSGWDLTQILRIPGTYNHKYSPPHKVGQAVVDHKTIYDVKDFVEYPELESEEEITPLESVELPDITAEKIIVKHKSILNPRAMDLFDETPEKDWSAKLWELECMLLEAGLSPEETFIVARESACNKYRRAGRPDSHLWKEILRAVVHVKDREQAPVEPDDIPHYEIHPPDLLTKEEVQEVESNETFIERYTNWASGLGDAAKQYHPAGAFVILSSLLCGSVKLPTSFGTVIPNIWFMILGDTTLTRKSTAMDNATDLLLDVDDEILLATDGSVEGLFTAMGMRSGKPSLFLRDEITGLIESMAKREYMAGMMELLTKMYDGKHMKRVLRRETIDIHNPRLVIFAGGIKTKMMEILSPRHIETGFLPRFVFITAETDITRIKPVGPPTIGHLDERHALIKYLERLYKRYAVPSTKKSNTGTGVHFPKQWVAELTEEAWYRYNSYEARMYDFALNSHDKSLLTPMMDRLAKSGLKASVLIAASRMEGDKVVVGEKDIIHAFYYVQQWQRHAAVILMNIGTSEDENKIQRVLASIRSNEGITRSKVMQMHWLTAREAENIFATLEQRNAISRKGRGTRMERLWPVN